MSTEPAHVPPPAGDPEPPPAPPRPFNAVLQEMERGALHAAASEELQKLVAAVLNEGKGGTLTLKITATPRGDAALELRGDLTSKAPKPARAASFFFSDDDGRLSRKHPNQLELEIGKPRAVTEPTPANAEEAR